MIKQMRVDFYRVMNGSEPLHDLHLHLDRVYRRRSGLARNCEMGGDAFRLQEYSSSGNRATGDMLRIRMENLPIKAGLDGTLDEFDLEDDEGIGEESAFLYDSSLAVLAYQRNRTGVPVGRFAEYIERMAAIEGPITFEPVLEPSAMEKFTRMRRKTKVELKCARADNPSFWPENDSVAQTIRNLSPLNAPYVNITASVGRQNGALDQSMLAEIVRSVIGYRQRNRVTKMEVSGRGAQDERLVVDLIEDRMVESVAMDVGRFRHAPYDSRARHIEQAYGTRHSQLARLFRRVERGRP